MQRTNVKKITRQTRWNSRIQLQQVAVCLIGHISWERKPPEFDTCRCSRPRKLKTRIPNNETDTLRKWKSHQSIHLHSFSVSSLNSYTDFQLKCKTLMDSWRTDTNIHLLRLVEPPFASARRFISTSDPSHPIHPFPFHWVQQNTVAQGGSTVGFCLDESVCRWMDSSWSDSHVLHQKCVQIKVILSCILLETTKNRYQMFIAGKQPNRKHGTLLRIVFETSFG